MSCAVFTLVGVIVLAFNKSNAWALGATFTAAVAMLLVASFLAWRDKHHEVMSLSSKIERLTSHADIRGSILDAYVRYPMASFKSPVMVCASFRNESPDVSPTIQEFVCQIDTPHGTLTSRTSHRSATDDIVLFRGVGRCCERGFMNLCHWNHQKLEKHNHREGWLLFIFNGLIQESLDGCTIRLFLVDGGGNQHSIGENLWPWPARNFRHAISKESRIPEDIE